MASYDEGKPEVCAYIREHYGPNAKILDVGAGDGKWKTLLPEYKMDAVEAFEQNAVALESAGMYRKVYHGEVQSTRYGRYDLIIFGDVLEHMTVEDAQKALAYAETHSKESIIGVPFRYIQGELYGNPYEIHIQDDLTAEKFADRYPGCRILLRPREDYCFYVREGKKNERNHG